MRRHWPRIMGIFCFAVLAAPATTLRAAPALPEGVHWQHDVEAAKTLARQTGRLVLVHVWTPGCGPCLAMDQNVFNQASVAGAIETRFVAVKLNANENPGTAEQLGITRVPTDVILTADGVVVGKLISPPVPAAYVAEVTQVAAEYASKSGQAFSKSEMPTSPQFNSAYANLQLAPNTPPAIAQPADSIQTGAFASTALGSGIALPTQFAPPPLTPVAAPADSLRMAAMPTTPANPSAPAIRPNLAPPSVSQTPGQVANPYLGSPPPPITPIAPSPNAANATAAAALTVRPDVGPTSPPQPQGSSSITPIAGAPDPKLLPPGAPPLGFDGYCPVSMRNNWKWVPGDARWGVVHRGRTYWFAGQTEQQQFWTDPDRYSPALSGMDPVMAIDHQQQVPGKREHSIDYDNLFYMFSSEATLQQFTANPERYAASVRQAMGIPRGRLVR